ncbi:MAG: hypothetical protein J2P59_09405, partial [Acidimicrobiales bacterium]|nr:hypothetical protein [Acidimicrobiales bacterium]
MKVGSWGLTSALGGHRATRATVAALVVVAAAVVAFGTGYRSTRALTNDESAWLRKGDTIVHINGPSARYDAVVSDKPNPIADAASDPLEVVQDQGGKVYTADPLTHKVYEIQLDRMTPVPGPNGTSVLAAGKVAYILDRAKRTLTAVNPKTMAPGATIRIPGPITGQAIAPNGTVYIGQSDGSLTIVSHGKAHTAQIAPKHSSLEVTMVGGRPVAVDVTHGRLYPLGANGRPTRSIAVPGGPGQRFEVPPSLPGQQAWLVHGSQLVGIDLAQGRAHTMALPSGHAFGSPVVNAGRVFVPDDTAGQVLQYQTTRQAALPPIAVPAGAPGVHDIEAFAKNGQVWIDNPSSQDAAMVGADGGVRTIDKGTGNDVVNPHARPGPARLASPSAPGQGTGTNAALSGPPTSDPSSLAPATSVAGDAGGFGAATAPGPGPGAGFGGGPPG